MKITKSIENQRIPSGCFNGKAIGVGMKSTLNNLIHVYCIASVMSAVVAL